MNRRSAPRQLPDHVHLVGIGGAGLSGVARILVARGHAVSGTDRAPSGMLEALEESQPGAGALRIELGESTAASLPADAELVVHSAAVGQDDPQLVEARRRGLSVLKYAEVLPLLAPPERLLAVAGTHGKTTTSWMLVYALVGLRLERGSDRLPPPSPGALIGGLCPQLETNALCGEEGGWFVAEACEYDRSFLHLRPRGAAITNVEPDHLDYYGDETALVEAFARFADQVHEDGLLVLGRDVPEAVESAARCNVWRLGEELEVQLLGEHRGCFRFRLLGPGWASPPVDMRVPGHFNVENAALALALAAGLASGESFPRKPALACAARALNGFRGAARRFETWGVTGEVEVVHDYAHHPTEVRVTVEAARRVFPDRPLHVLFQPHQHSRTARLLDDFVESLRAADRVVVADVYGARTHIDGARTAGAPELVDRLRALNVDAVAGGDARTAVQRLADGLPRRAAVLVLGAGDIELVKHELLERLALRGTPGSRAGS